MTTYYVPELTNAAGGGRRGRKEQGRGEEGALGRDVLSFALLFSPLWSCIVLQVVLFSPMANEGKEGMGGRGER